MPTLAPTRPYRMVARAEAAAGTRRRLLEAAWDAFSTQPYEAVRMQDVAAAAGVTVPTLHARGGTKDELFVAAWRHTIGREGDRRNEAPVGDVDGAVRLLYDSYELRGDAALFLLAEEARIPAVREMAEAGRAWHRAWVERTFAPLIDARAERIHALVVATDLLVWKLLRREMRLGRAEAERVVIDMVKGPA